MRLNVLPRMLESPDVIPAVIHAEKKRVAG
jgi:hypothetical protein